MNTRMNILQTEPGIYKAMNELESYLKTTSLTPTQKGLIKIRASQINGCAYCIDMHTNEARKEGETEQRIYLLNAWKETSLYTEEEKVLLSLTEEVTQISRGGVSDKTYNRALQLFDTRQIAQIIMAVITINAWNRIAISTQMQPD